MWSSDWVPHADGASLYIRPFVFANDVGLGVHASKHYIFCIICSPSGAYYAEGIDPVRIYVEDEYIRAAPGLTGFTKCGGNYAASIKAGELAEEQGYAQVLWLDGVEKKYVEEVGSMNIMFKIDGKVYTAACRRHRAARRHPPQLHRAAARTGAMRSLRASWPSPTSWQAAREGKLEEVFGTGTAAVVSPVKELVWKGEHAYIGERQDRSRHPEAVRHHDRHAVGQDPRHQGLDRPRCQEVLSDLRFSLFRIFASAARLIPRRRLPYPAALVAIPFAWCYTKISLSRTRGNWNMIKKWTIRYPAVNGEEDRRMYVYLPTMYEADPDRRYPVLYMFDGQNVFFDADATYGKSWGMADYLDYTDTPLIVAAIECNAGPNNERLVEYSPYRFDDPTYGHFDGRGRETLDWFVRELKPTIDANFRTQPDRGHTFIGGSSMGGLMSLYALLAYNDIFGRAAALSPSLWVAPAALMNLTARTKLAPGTVLYMDYGSQEMGNHEGMRKGFGEMCNKIFARGIHLTARIVPGGTHSEASWEKQLPFVFHTLMYGVEE